MLNVNGSSQSVFPSNEREEEVNKEVRIPIK